VKWGRPPPGHLAGTAFDGCVQVQRHGGHGVR
jgi:hypothetical protein